jgi:hypothetical protein
MIRRLEMVRDVNAIVNQEDNLRIDSISVNPDSVMDVRKHVSKAEGDRA